MRCGVLVLAAALYSSPSYAQDECKDVLVNAVMNRLQVQKDTYYSTAILSTVDESSDSQEQQNANAGVVIEGIPISLSYADAKRLKTNISKYYSLQAIASDRSSYLLMSGQENIIKAWSDCMKGGGRGAGFSIRFKPLDGNAGKQTLLIIEYYKNNDPMIQQYDLELTSDVYLNPSFQIQANADCLKKGRIFKPNDTCTVQLITNSENPPWATSPVVFIMKAHSPVETTASYSAYLGPRAILKGESEPWPAQGTKVTGRTYSLDHGVTSPEECFYATDGWVLLEKSINITRHPEGGATVATCLPNKYPDGKEYSLDATGRRLCVTQVNGTPSRADHYCSLSITATEATTKWDPLPPSH
jgi:hypothetical protein